MLGRLVRRLRPRGPRSPGTALAPEPRFRFWVDSCHASPAHLTMRGWAFFEDAAVTVLEATVLGRDGRRERKRLAVEYGHERGDVREAYRCPHSLHCGFAATMPTPGFRPRTVELVFHTADGRSGRVRARVRRAPVAWLKLVRAVRKEATPANIRLAAGWLLRGEFRRFGREIFGLLDAAPATRRTIAVASVMERIVEAPRPDPLAAPVDVIVPVYNGYEHLRPLFESLRRNTSQPHRLIVIHDASPDPRIEPLLESLLAGHDSCLLIRNEVNLGFVRSVNRAAERATNDFVLLNADTIVPPGWLERLMAPIRRDRSIASVTPFSNAATICSFPDFCRDNTMLAGESVETVDAAFSRIRPLAPEIELPTGIGFCMGINREVWLKVGPFDAEAFGRGYGEENDWSRRALAAGHRHVLVENLFIQHEHGGSFESETRQKLRDDNLRLVQQRHPGYAAAVDAFIKADPPMEARAVAALLLAGMRRDPAPILIIDHDLGGGATHYRERLVRTRTKTGQPVLVLHATRRETGGGGLALRLYLDDSRFDLAATGLEEIETLLDSHLPVGEIFYNNLVSHGAPLDVVDFARRLRARGPDRLTIAIHDFYPVCPAYTLLDKDGEFCGVPSDLAVCRACLPKNPFAANPRACSIEDWRAGWGALFAAADDVICFSPDSRTHLLKAYPDIGSKISIEPHELDVAFDRRPHLAGNDALRIGVVGGISYQKGAKVVADLARHLSANDPDAIITVIGLLNDAPELPNLTITGRYEPAQLPALLEAHQIDVCLIPSIWPETFSYVTAELMALDIPIVAFDIGAPAERLRDYPRGLVVDLDMAKRPHDLARALRGHLAR